jgi:hypothetical protein
MPLANIISNIGIGKVEATFENLTTTASDAVANHFTETMLDNQHVAACQLGNNIVGHLTTTYGLFGAVLAVSDKARDDVPAQAEKVAVQISGISEIQGTTGAAALNSAQRAWLPAGRNGLVTQLTTSFAPAGVRRASRGRIINVWDTDRCSVLL